MLINKKEEDRFSIEKMVSIQPDSGVAAAVAQPPTVGRGADAWWRHLLSLICLRTNKVSNDNLCVNNMHGFD